MIGVKVDGRLGNQMFQYAFAYAQSRKRLTLFFLIRNLPNQDLYQLEKFFRLRFGEWYLMRFAERLYFFLFKKTRIYKKFTQIGGEDIMEILSKTTRRICCEGYFQSEQYFKPFDKQIKELFFVRKKYRNKFLNKYQDLFKHHKVLVIHIRRTDYLTWGSDEFGGTNLSLPMSYYEDCLHKIHNITDYRVLVLSDDIEFAKKYFSNKIDWCFESNEHIVDFQIMQHADKLIIANSSFSWWAGYLNIKKAEVFAPKYWVGFKVGIEYPKGIMIDKFTWVDVS